MFKKIWDKVFGKSEKSSKPLQRSPEQTIKDKQLLTQLNRQVSELTDRGRYQLALSPANQALKLTRESLGEHHPDVAQCLNALAGIYEAMDNAKTAESYYRKAKEIEEIVLKEHPELKNLFDRSAKPSKPLQVQASISHTSDGHEQLITQLNKQASELYEQGRYQQAIAPATQSLELTRQTLGEQHPSFAIRLDNLAMLYFSIGNFAQAEPLLRQALEIDRIALGEQHPSFAIRLDNLAMLYFSIGNFAQAEPLLRQALEIDRIAVGELHPDFAGSLNNLAALYQATSNFAQAEPLYRQALEIWRIALGEQHPNFAISLNNLAGLYKLMGNFAQAEPLYRQALEIWRIALGEQHPNFAISLNNLAMLYYSTGKFAQAEPLYRQALEIRRMSLGEFHPDFAQNLNNLAALYIATNRALEGYKLMEQAEAIEDRMIGQVFSISSESQRAAYLKTIGWNRYLSLVNQYLSDSPDAIRSALNLILRRKAIQAEALASQRDLVLGGKYPKLEPKLRKVMALRNQIAQKTMAGPSTEDLKTHEQALTDWNSEKERLEADLARQIPEMNLEQKLRAVDRQAITMAMPVDSILVEFVRFDLHDFKAVPARGERRWKSARYLAFTIVAGEPDNIQMIDLGEADPIDQMIATFRSTITGEAEGQSSRGLGAIPLELQQPEIEQKREDDSIPGVALRKALFDPLIPAIGNRKRILISPDGDLTRLPFEVLPTGNQRLIDIYQISYLGAGRDLLRYGIKTGRQAAIPLVIADPDFDLSGIDPVIVTSSTQQSTSASATSTQNRSNSSRDFDRSGMLFPRLKGTQWEGKAIAAKLKVEPVLAGDALETRLKGCQSPRILHIATHGFFLPDQKRDPNEETRLTTTRLENPLLRSGLALAGVNTWLKHGELPAAAEDGVLTAEDVSGLDLLDTDLVVLSACQTGLGEVKVGEGVFGLRRAFVLAGAKTLVMSLWKVPDDETKLLMEDFYQRILAGEPRNQALREAQLSLKAKYPDPLYWGAFICQGDSNPIGS